MFISPSKCSGRLIGFHFLKCAGGALLLFFASCGQNDTVLLQWDISPQGIKTYDLTVEVSGEVTFPSSSRLFSGTLKGLLEAAPAENDSSRLVFRVNDPNLSANFLTSSEVRHSTTLLRQQAATLVVEDGDLALPDALGDFVPVPGQWDLLRNISRVLPSFPHSPTRVGTIWDRQRTLPLATREGEALGHLFQSFLLDSIHTEEEKQLAWISWDYTYKVELLAEYTTSILEQLPSGGKGKGHARVDVSRNVLEYAYAEFNTVTKHSVDSLEITWKETVEIANADK